MSGTEKEMYQNAKKSIENDNTLSEIQKDKLIQELNKKINSEPNPNEKTLSVKVSVDESTLKEMAVENAQLRAKINEDTVKIADKVRETLRLKFSELGLDAPSRLQTVEEMDNATQILRELQKKNKPQEAPSGSAPLSGQYVGIENIIGYETHDEMIDALRFQENHGTEEEKAQAKQILNQLFEKWVNAKHEDPNLIDKMPNNLTPNEYKKKTKKGVKYEP